MDPIKAVGTPNCGAAPTRNAASAVVKYLCGAIYNHFRRRWIIPCPRRRSEEGE